MIKVFCDACDKQLVTAVQMTIIGKGGMGRTKDLCAECVNFLNHELEHAFEILKADPDKHKLKYDF